MNKIVLARDVHAQGQDMQNPGGMKESMHSGNLWGLLYGGIVPGYGGRESRTCRQGPDPK